MGPESFGIAHLIAPKTPVDVVEKPADPVVVESNPTTGTVEKLAETEKRIDLSQSTPSVETTEKQAPVVVEANTTETEPEVKGDWENLSDWQDTEIETPTPVVNTPTQTPDILTELGKTLGKTFKDTQDVLSFFKEVQSQPPKVVNQFPGLDEPTSQVVLEAIDSGILTRDEAIGGHLFTDFHKLPIADLAYDGILEMAAKRGESLTNEQVEEELAEMTDREKKILAHSYAEQMNQKREGIMSRIQANVHSQTQRKAQEAAQRDQEMARYKTDVLKTVQALNEPIPGTKTVLTEDMKKTLTKALTDPAYITRILKGQGTPEKQLENMAYNLARVAFPKQIAKDLMTTAKNEAIKGIIEENQNIVVRSQNGRPVTPGTGKTNIQAGMDKINEFFNPNQ
jgi:hypothetical protein